MRRYIAWLLVAAVLGTLFWYFLKPHDYVVRFTSRASSGTINQTVKLWAKTLQDAHFLEQQDLNEFKYRLRFNDSTHFYRWKITGLNDSTMRVAAYVTDSANSFSNRLALPFSDTDFEKRSKNTVQDLMFVLNEHLDRFKVTVVGERNFPSKYCACVPLKSKQSEKANKMMDYYSLLSSFMAENGIQLDGQPLVEVENWNIQNDSLVYNFCFPIIKRDSLPQRNDLFYKKIDSKKALHAIYNGNYITSDRSWYDLLDYAKTKNLKVEAKPLEVFYSNPNMGGNALEWETKVFMPLKKD